MQGETHFVLNPSLIGVMLGDPLNEREDQVVPFFLLRLGIECLGVQSNS